MAVCQLFFGLFRFLSPWLFLFRLCAAVALALFLLDGLFFISCLQKTKLVARSLSCFLQTVGMDRPSFFGDLLIAPTYNVRDIIPHNERLTVKTVSFFNVSYYLLKAFFAVKIIAAAAANVTTLKAEMIVTLTVSAVTGDKVSVSEITNLTGTPL